MHATSQRRTRPAGVHAIRLATTHSPGRSAPPPAASIAGSPHEPQVRNPNRRASRVHLRRTAPLAAPHRRPHPQPQGHLLRHPARPSDRGHRPLGRRQVLARLRHPLRRRPAPLRRVDVDLRPAVPPAAGAPAGRRPRARAARCRARGRQPGPQRPLHGRHDHRGARRAAPALRLPRRGPVRRRLRPDARLHRRVGGGGARRRPRRRATSCSSRRLPRPARARRRQAAASWCARATSAVWRDGEIARVARRRRRGRPSADPLPLRARPFPRRRCASSRLADAVEEGFRLARGRPARRSGAAGGSAAKPVQLAEELGCPVCGEAARRPVPALFSFNSPLGACADCRASAASSASTASASSPIPARACASARSRRGTRPSYEEHYDAAAPAAAGAACRSTCRGRSCRRRCASGSGPTARRRAAMAARELPRPLRASSPGSRRAPTASTCACCSRATAPTTPCPACGGARLQPEALRVRLQRPHAPRAARALGRGAAPLARRAAAGADARARPRRASARRSWRDRLDVLAPGGPRLPHPRPPGAHALGRRGAAHPSRGGARLRPHRHALRARRADHRPAPARQPSGCSRCCATSRRAATRCWWSSTTAR